MNDIPTQDFDEWYSINRHYSCQEIDNLIYIKLSEIPDDGRHSKKAEWLKENGKYIDFDKSAQFIERSHNVTLTGGTLPIARRGFVDITLQEFKGAINKIVPNTYNDDCYNNYINIQLDPSNPDYSKRIIITLENKFNYGKINFSIPLFRSIIKNHESELGLNPILEFGEASIENFDTIFFKFRHSNFNFTFFDYTNYPTLTGVLNPL